VSQHILRGAKEPILLQAEVRQVATTKKWLHKHGKPISFAA